MLFLNMEPIILASGSPRRQEFFTLLGLPFSSIPSGAEESCDPALSPGAAAEELARTKVKTIAQIRPEAPWICGADTIIVLEGKIYGKARDREEARATLRALQGKTHEVITAIALGGASKALPGSAPGADKTICRSFTSTVTFAAMTEAEVEWYLDSGEWQDAAGAYKIQGLASCFISRIEGSYSSIVGLPLREIYVMLRENGYPYGAGYSS